MKLRGRLIVAAALAAGVVLVGLAWWRLPPPAVRRLPEGQTVVYVNAALLRRAQALLPAASLAGTPAPEYQAFVQESGFDYTRDLDGLGISAIGSPTAPEQATAILSGRFSPQFSAYLRRHARRALELDGVEAYEFPGWARPQQAITVALLDGHTLLATNAPVAEPVVARAERGWPGAWLQAPRLWQGGSAGPTLVAYAASDIRELAAERAVGNGRKWLIRLRGYEVPGPYPTKNKGQAGTACLCRGLRPRRLPLVGSPRPRQDRPSGPTGRSLSPATEWDLEGHPIAAPAL